MHTQIYIIYISSYKYNIIAYDLKSVYMSCHWDDSKYYYSLGHKTTLFSSVYY